MKKHLLLIGLLLPHLALATYLGDPVTTKHGGTQSDSSAATGIPHVSSGTWSYSALVGADLPNPAAATLGGVRSLTCAANQFFTQISTSGIPACTQPNFTDLAGSISTSQIPNTAVTPGSYTSANITVDAQGRITAAANGAGGGGTVTSVSGTAPIVSSGGSTPVISCVVATGSVAGCLASADFTTFNAKQAAISTSAAVANQFVTGFTAPNTFTRAQPAFSDLSGSATAAQMPAFSGDITTSGGSTATTLANTAVAAGSYTSANITVDAKGRITAAANGSGGGSGTLTKATKTANYTVAGEDVIFLNGTFTLTLEAATARNKVLRLINIGTGTVTVARAGADTIGNELAPTSTTMLIGPGQAIPLISDDVSIYRIAD